MYGLIISIIFMSEISSRDEGVGTWLASVWLLVLSFVAWVCLEVCPPGSGSIRGSQTFLQTALVTFVVAGIEALAIGLLPMRFLPGHPLYRWRSSMWFPLFALAIFGYLLILVNPVNGYLSNDSHHPDDHRHRSSWSASASCRSGRGPTSATGQPGLAATDQARLWRPTNRCGQPANQPTLMS